MYRRNNEKNNEYFPQILHFYYKSITPYYDTRRQSPAKSDNGSSASSIYGKCMLKSKRMFKRADRNFL